MKIEKLFKGKKKVLSFEVFPPKRDDHIEGIYRTLEELALLEPDFISVTYGASGTLADNKTVEIATAIQRDYGITSLAHLTCANSTKIEVGQVLDSLKENNVENILALRGDLIPGKEPKQDFAHASDLIEFVREEGYDFGISAACYPEGHQESQNQVFDIVNLRKKVDAGAQHLISQLFFDNSYFYDFLIKSRIAGIEVPVEAGIMPVTNKKSISKMVNLCGATLPSKFLRVMEKYENRPEALRDAGIAYAVDQIVDLLCSDVDGVHVYTMNNPYIAKRIVESLRSLF